MSQKQENMMFEFDRLSRVIRRQKHNKRPIRRGSLRILNIIQDNPKISTKEVAERLDIRVSSLNEHLSLLIDKELIVRTQNEKDRRTYGLELTPQGSDLLEGLKKEKRAFYEKVEQILNDEERETMTRLLRKLSEGLKKEDCQCQ
ncbi:MAG: winged helix-turn-helix transcriptional regulator [Erysipelothrix sp.]|nr:winged helix-turn-helix transcriptional regulator [Erysipelothrix sp.]